MDKPIYLSPPVYEDRIVIPIMQSGDVYENINKVVLDFETSVQAFLETKKQVVALNSGTSAIHLALILAGVQKGDLVLCQSMTFVACANPILYQGATPVFIDSEENTWNMSPKFLKEAYFECCRKGKIPKAIIVTSLYGLSSNMEAILSFAKAKNIKVIEDSAEALGSTYCNRKLSTIGDYGILSFNLNKIVSTGGGGVLVVNTLEEKEKAIFLATQAKEKLTYYQHTTLGYNYRMSHLNAALGIIQLNKLKDNLEKKAHNFNFYNSLFTNIRGVSLHKEPSNDYNSNYWLNAILIDSSKTGGIDKEDLYNAFAKANIESRPLWKPMHLQPIFENTEFYGDGVSSKLFENGLCLPSGSNLTNDDKERIQKVIFELFNNK